MDQLDYFDALLIAGAALLAVRALTRLMRARRNRLIGEIQQQVAAEQERRRLEEKKKKKQEAAA